MTITREETERLIRELEFNCHDDPPVGIADHLRATQVELDRLAKLEAAVGGVFSTPGGFGPLLQKTLEAERPRSPRDVADALIRIAEMAGK